MATEVDFDVSEIMLDLFKSNKADTNKKIKNFLNYQARRSKQKIDDIAIARVNRSDTEKPDSKRYHTGFKKGKPYKDNEEMWGIRVYNNRPHAHLIEEGHDIVRGGKKGMGGKTVGRARAYNVLDDFGKEYASEFYTKCDKFVDKLLKEGFSW